MAKLSYPDALQVYLASHEAPYSVALGKTLLPAAEHSYRRRQPDGWVLRNAHGFLAVVYDSGHVRAPGPAARLP